MTFDEVERHSARVDTAHHPDARELLAGWFEDAGTDIVELSRDVRIVLVSVGFGSEITTTVL